MVLGDIAGRDWAGALADGAIAAGADGDGAGEGDGLAGPHGNMAVIGLDEGHAARDNIRRLELV
jgi:hypothetical protein